ncbi:MAG: hypothetical protein BroJett001_17620 [Chloroflexota bacterium]|nr:MAG: hypothetical protein BroJett001_17620 [Chloroflexota bacterium]
MVVTKPALAYMDATGGNGYFRRLANRLAAGLILAGVTDENEQLLPFRVRHCLPPAVYLGMFYS